jgi:hypothetical protein
VNDPATLPCSCSPTHPSPSSTNSCQRCRHSTISNVECKKSCANRIGRGAFDRRHGRTDNFSLRSIYVSVLRVQNLHISTLVENPSGWCAIYDSRWKESGVGQGHTGDWSCKGQTGQVKSGIRTGFSGSLSGSSGPEGGWWHRRGAAA